MDEKWHEMIHALKQIMFDGLQGFVVRELILGSFATKPCRPWEPKIVY